VNNAAFLVEVSDALCDLEDDVPRQVLTEVSQLDDLVEELSPSHHCRATVNNDVDEESAANTYIPKPGNNALEIQKMNAA
jgi:hypothetical protein